MAIPQPKPGGTLFFKRSSYSVTTARVPNCFVRLDERFSELGIGPIPTARPVVLAEHLCRRMADVAYFAEAIEGAISTHTGSHLFNGADVVGTLLSAHFGGCKSVLDAATMALNDCFGLGLTGGQLDVRSGKFWQRLQESDTAACGRYSRHRSFCTEVVRWRDSAVHRSAPLTMVIAPSRPGTTDAAVTDGWIVFCLEPDIDINGLLAVMRRTGRGPFVDPLHLHERWQPTLVDVCSEVCDDIGAWAAR